MQIIRDLLASKKVVMAILGLVLTALSPWLATTLGITIDPGQLAEHIAVIVTGYLVGQGVADHGKEAAHVNAAAGGTPLTAVLTSPEPKPRKTRKALGETPPMPDM